MSVGGEIMDIYVDVGIIIALVLFGIFYYAAKKDGTW